MKTAVEILKEDIEGVFERKFDLGHGALGNGVTVWNRAKEVHGDYEKVAHIGADRKIKWYIKNPPKAVKDYVEKIAKGKNFAASSSQPDKKVFKEGSTASKEIAIDTIKALKRDTEKLRDAIKAFRSSKYSQPAGLMPKALDRAAKHVDSALAELAKIW